VLAFCTNFLYNLYSIILNNYQLIPGAVSPMLTSPDLMRALLLICLLGMAILAALFLRTRQLPFFSFLLWGLLALFLPLLGPFLVILSNPGSKHT